MNGFSLGLHTRNLGTQTRQMTNPFTSERVTVHIDDGMTPAETEAASSLLADAGATKADPDGFRKVVFPDGSYAHMNLRSAGAEIEVSGGVTIDLVEFIFRLALASGMIVQSTIDPDVVAILPGQHHAGIGNRWPDATQIHSAHELMEWIKSELTNGRIA
jgi:hypothetical protein